MTQTFRILPALFPAAGLAGLMALPLPSTAQEAMPELSVALGVVDANFNPTTASVFQLAEELGYFEKHGVKVTYVKLDGTPQAAAALYSGSVDLADISIDTALRLRADNDVAVRGVVASSIGSAFLIAAKSEIASVEDLEGRSFAIADYGSLDHALTQAVFTEYGLSPEMPDYVAIGAPDVRIQALAAGKVDATTVSFGTYSSIGAVDSVHVIVPPDEFSSRSPALTKFVAGLEETLTEKQDAVQRFTAALIETSRDMQADPDRWVDIAAEKRPDLTRESLVQSAELNASRWCINGCMSPAELEKTLAFIYGKPDFEGVAVIDYADMSDLSFTENAMAELGDAEGFGLDLRN
ncbi:ABC transporter substrate-binding protein [Maritimibacter sp. DP1N21-5]|uniref:ABC transporter substrate-binding protein n=1 Tax=Maritimibacter sp. DP1N21-5 TaxID=2836867 RepID=UPI001C468941|nr:ABC transporter substrate-binding protein [Maritimibacter sp. DP1N21-5]MBV7410693.1 ABC transporter substrate-binding protein [Maritimibacter sp. DP1N21-5]